MVELEQYKFTVNQYKEPMKELGVSLALSHKHEQIKELESEMREEGFWNDPDKAQEVTRKVKNLQVILQYLESHWHHFLHYQVQSW